MKDKENRKAEDRSHKISRKIVDKAAEDSSMILIGDLKGLGNRDRGKGKRTNRIDNSTPYWKLTKMVEYKAKENGIRVVKIDEYGTSRTCNRCSSENTSRPTQGRFDCGTCGLETHSADLNGAKNILQRFLAYTMWNRASVNRPIIEAYSGKNEIEDPGKALGGLLLTPG